ncbi:hypothetical protein KIN20_003030 [Parelaphostrongylus tenuis]|uniref:TFIIS N-terminal domain-containing protein n=1 Tax=Parelaphostrongylus tenuis TaxID=148309 RepID=A0AAD5LWP3_PARTN|nr:hypothetical protein KIN20_003030 [Parelaphostrongylus tenuis]
MTVDNEVLSKVAKYGKLIKRKERIGHALRKLGNIEMTLDILSATNIGRYVNKLSHDPTYGREACQIVERWKEIARQSGVRGDEENCASAENDDNPQEYEQEVKEACYDDVSGRSSDGETSSRNGANTRADNKDHGHEVVSRKTYHSETKRDAGDPSDRDFERYRHRRDDRDAQSKHHSDYSERSYENCRRNRDGNECDQKQKSRETTKNRDVSSKHDHREDHYGRRVEEKCYRDQERRETDQHRRGSSKHGQEDYRRNPDEDKSCRRQKHDDNDNSRRDHESNHRCGVEMKYDRKQRGGETDANMETRYDYDGRCAEGDEHENDNYLTSALKNLDEEDRSESPLDKVEKAPCNSNEERQLSSRNVHKRGHFPTEEKLSSPKAKSKRSEAASSAACSNFQAKPEHTSLSSSSNSKMKPVCKNVAPDFGTMLLSADSSPTKARKPREAHMELPQPPILNNYQPFPQAVRVVKDATHPPAADNFNPESMFKPRHERRKVFAGRRRVTTRDVPSLFTLCSRLLMNNIRVLYYAKYINYDVVKPILERCTSEELAHIESRHQYLEEDSGELWQRFVAAKKYSGEKPTYTESWKELYYSLEKEEEEKLKQLSLRIGKMHNTDTKVSRKAILADATAPAFVKRRQMRHGTTHVSTTLPSALEVSNARRQIFETGGSKDALTSLPSAIVKSSSAFIGRTEKKKAPTKKGALMIKTMKMLNMKRK